MKENLLKALYDCVSKDPGLFPELSFEIDGEEQRLDSKIEECVAGDFAVKDDIRNRALGIANLNEYRGFLMGFETALQVMGR